MQLAEERRQSIIEAVEREGRVLAAELAQRLDTSEDTIRRDLRDLDAAGLLRRVHGGAVRRTREASFGERVERDPARKSTLAQALCTLVRPGDTVLIDADDAQVGVCALDPERGLAASDAEEATIKAAMVTGSTRRAAALLNERLGDSAPFAFARLAELDHLVLEADAPLDTIARLRQAHPGLDLQLAPKVRT